MRRFTESSKRTRSRPIRVLFIVPYPKDCAPSQRLKFEQYLSYLTAHGVEYEFSSFMSPALWKVVYQKGHYPTKILHTLIGYSRRCWDVLRSRKFDLIYLHLEAAPFGPPIFERLFRWRGVPILYDIDDLIYLPRESPANPLAKFFRNYDKIPAIIQMSERVIVVTKYLVEYTKRYNQDIVFIPPTINTTAYRQKSDSSKRKVCIGWTGSYSTSKYLRLLEPVLREICKRYDVRIKVVGDEHFQIPGLPIEAKRWELAHEVADLHDIDIGLYPLPKTEWVLGKGGLKALQYMGMGIPTICTPYGAALEIIEDGKNGFLADTHAEWITKLSQLVEDAALRKRLGENGRKTVLGNYSIAVYAPAYLQTIRSFLKLRILYLINDLDIGGTEKVVASLVQHLDARKYQLAVCSITPPGQVATELTGIPNVSLHTLNLQSKFNLFVFFKLYALLRRMRPHILQTYLFYDNFLGRIIGQLARVPLVISGQRAINLAEPYWRVLFEKHLSALSDLIISNSHAGKRVLIQRENIPQKKLLVIQNGKDLALFDRRVDVDAIRSQLRIPPKKKVITVVAKLREQKGHQYLLQAAVTVLQQHPDTVFLLVGDGPLRSTLQAMTEALGITRQVRFLGDRETVVDILAITDIFVMPSLWEGLSNAIIEAMAMRLPVIATNVSGTPELVQHGKTGYLVPPSVSDALADRILYLIDHPQLCKRFGAAGRARVEQHFTIAKMVSAYEHLYDSFARAPEMRRIGAS